MTNQVINVKSVSLDDGFTYAFFNTDRPLFGMYRCSHDELIVHTMEEIPAVHSVPFDQLYFYGTRLGKSITFPVTVQPVGTSMNGMVRHFVVDSEPYVRSPPMAFINRIIQKYGNHRRRVRYGGTTFHIQREVPDLCIEE